MESRHNIYTLSDRLVQSVSDVGECDSFSVPTFRYCIEQVMKTDLGDVFKMSHLTIMLEALYRQPILNHGLKSKLLALRLDRWGGHFGTPTVTFLLTHDKQIRETATFLRNGNASNSALKPWLIEQTDQLLTDRSNQVVVNPKCMNEVSLPEAEERTGQFIKTHNPTGGFTTTPCDPVSQQFIQYASEVAGQGGTVLEIGAAFGAASLQALAKGARVFCNDIEASNIAVVRRRYNASKTEDSITGDDAKLVLVPGSFPDELAGLPKKYFDAILICRVLHFFNGAKIEESLKQLSENLKEGGKLYIVCETPYLKNWQRFIPEFNKRVEAGVKWPGEITNPAEYESSGRAALLPSFVHWITKEVLEKSLAQSNLGVEYLSYINRSGQFPDDLLLDGRESVGAVAAKPY